MALSQTGHLSPSGETILTSHLCRSGLLLPFLLAITACAAAPLSGGSSRSVIVGFTLATPGDAPEALERLKKAGATDARFVSSLSSRSHSYRLTCPPVDPACDKVLDALRGQPGIDYVSIDRGKDSQ